MATSTEAPANVKRLFEVLVKGRGSDLFIKPGSKPSMRVDGAVKFVADAESSKAFTKVLLDAVMAGRPMPPPSVKEWDLAIEFPGIGRFRGNIFRQQGEIAFVFRHINDTIPSFEELGMPPRALQRLASLKRGLVLVTGVAGSGKSTTIAAMLEYINQTRNAHIVTRAKMRTNIWS